MPLTPTTALLLVLLLLCFGSKADGGVLSQCARATPGQDTPLATNRVNRDTWEPLFHLIVNHDGNGTYSVSVKVGSSQLAFSDAFISVETNSSCGVGDLLYDNDDFVMTDGGHCPHVLTTNSKHPMRHLPPLRWKMPRCGCVHFRVIIIVEGHTYFAEHEDDMEGPLATTVCAASPESAHKKVSREERHDLLCRINSKFSGAEILQRGEFMERHQLNPRFLDRSKMEMALHARRSDILECCQKLHVAREECFDDVRRRRVDDVCDDGSPEIPFTSQRMRFMRDREQACCWKIGEARYDCFALNAGTKHDAWSPDFSLDESDPVNDLGDYPTEILELEQEYDTPLFGMVGSTEQITTTPTTTSTTVVATTRMTTTTPPIKDRKTVAVQGVPPSSTDKRSSKELDDDTETRTSSRERKIRHHVKHQKPRSREQSHIGMDAGVASSRELGEQQGGRSAQKTQSKLERRIWKMQLKTSCCQGGMEAASGLVGAYQTVWHECKHSSNKFLLVQSERDGRHICMNEFRFCCMDMATSLSTGVVTSQPETESSAEWDPDRDLVGKIYLPPYSRAGPAQALRRTSSLVTTRTPRNSQERSWPSGSLRVRGSSSVTQPEVEDPQHKRRAERVPMQSLRTQLKEEDDIDEDYRPVMKDPRRTASLASPSFAARRRETEKPPTGSDQKGRGESEFGEELQNGKQSEAKRKRSRSQEVSAVVGSADQDGKEGRRTASLEAARRRLKHRRHETEEELLRWLLLEVDQDHVDDLVDEEENALGSEEIASTASAEYEDDDEAGDGDDEYFDSKDVDRIHNEEFFASASKDRNSRGNSQNADMENGREEKRDGDKQVVHVVAQSGGYEQGPQQSPSEGREQPLESARDISASSSGREPSEGRETAQTPVRGRPEKGRRNNGFRSSAPVSEFTKDAEIAADDLSSEDGHNSSRYHHPPSGGRSTRKHFRGRMVRGRLGKNVRREEHMKPRITEALEEE